MKNNNQEVTGPEAMEIALNKLIADPAAVINQLQVANLAGFNHSNFRKKSYKDVKEKIIAAQKVRDSELEQLSLEQKINKLESELSEAKATISNLRKKKTLEPTKKEIKANESELIAKLTEMYKYNDALRFELIDKHQTDIDQETGEILHVQFGRKK